MAKTVETFDAVSITNGSAQFFEGGQQQPAKKFGCLGTVEGETELKELVKLCEGVEVAKSTKPLRHTLTISAHIPIPVVRDVFGLTNDGLKPGVYKYSKKAQGKKFVFTADVIDEFENITKLIAFPNCVSATGFTFTVENGADEVAEMEVELTAYPDSHGNLYYEALTSELDDPSISDTWHSQFDYTLVEKASIPS